MPELEPTIRPPIARDGAAVFDLIAACAPLEQNSLYCNVLQCTHFADTCRVATEGDQTVGWVSGYRPPADPETLFIWQVAVSPTMRGRGLGKSLLKAVCTDNADIRCLQTTITEDNAASWALFEAFADESGATFSHKPFLGKETHFSGRHDTEHMVTIAPLSALA